jgi:hypothetical protein
MLAQKKIVGPVLYVLEYPSWKVPVFVNENLPVQVLDCTGRPLYILFMVMNYPPPLPPPEGLESVPDPGVGVGVGNSSNRTRLVCPPERTAAEAAAFELNSGVMIANTSTAIKHNIAIFLSVVIETS